ncbi:MAG TPA: hypothetical protein VM754_08955, partial [Actinomycetota bacterium]|nr:hypothetical protein [Actinomycetota bacterium]
MASDRTARFRYRLETRIYEMRREQALRSARIRYRMDNLGASGPIRLTMLALLGAMPFLLFFLFQPTRPIAVEDTTNTISRNIGPRAPALAFPLT